MNAEDHTPEPQRLTGKEPLSAPVPHPRSRRRPSPGPSAPDGDSHTADADGNTDPAEDRMPPDAAAPAEPAPDTPSARLRRLGNALGSLPLLSPVPPPFSRSRWLRWATYVVVCLIAVAMALNAKEQIKKDYGLDEELGRVPGYAHGVALALALWYPGLAWALSLAGMVFVAVLAPPVPVLGEAQPSGPDWPWNTAELWAHTFVLLLLALRVRPRFSFGALVVTGLTTYALQGFADDGRYSSTGTMAVAVFAAAVLVGGALRARSKARSQLVEQESIAAEERAHRTLLEERSRIARELHDVVAHHMSVISIQAQVIPHLVENPSEELKENLASIRRNSLEALTELRRMLGVLRSENPGDPHGLGGPGTGSAPDAPQPTLDRLGALIDNTRAAGLDVIADLGGEAPLYPPGVELSAYRIVQEALSNALRHAPGSTVRVRISHLPHGLHLEVVNSRPRRPVPPSPGAGHGLLGMRERATMLGGHLTATRTPQGGFAVSAFLPCDDRASADAPPSDFRT